MQNLIYSHILTRRKPSSKMWIITPFKPILMKSINVEEKMGKVVFLLAHFAFTITYSTKLWRLL